MIGRTIARYRIVEKLGSGGMGDVYRAEDTTLGRPVALKFLAAHLLHDEEAKQRFEREAKAAAAISHPNICHVYEIGEEDGRTFLAMAYIEGEPLEDRIARGPLPLRDALDIGRQVAEGLEAAHEKGVVHRDIKPANILVDAKGRATILDFGLARLTEASKLTRADQTVGTAAYMSPEQIQGAEVDHRTDIWALGCVLYEMVAGVRPFKGQYDQALLYEVIHEEPEPLTAIRAGVPMELEVFVGKCLAKDAADRYDRAAELAKDLRTLGEKIKSGRSTVVSVAALSGAHRISPSSGARVREEPFRRKFQLAAVAAVLGIAAAGGLALLHFSEAPVERPLRKWSFSPDGLQSSLDITPGVAISPNGRHIVYHRSVQGGSELWIRDIDQVEPRPLVQTGGARGPFWSPDSRFVGFNEDGEIKKIPVEGGTATKVCPAPGIKLGASWSPDGESIVFSYFTSGGGTPQLWEVPAIGGQPTPLFEQPEETEKGRGNSYPHFLPTEAGARAILLEVGNPREHDIVLKNLETGESQILAEGSGGEGSSLAYSPTGHILYRLESELWALPFSIDRLRPVGEAFPLGVETDSASLANDGTLVWLPSTGPSSLRQLVWRNRAGEKVGEIGQPQAEIRFPALSPDGRSVVVHTTETRDLWVHEVDRPVKRRVTFGEGDESRPRWSPTGREIAFSATDGGGEHYDLYRRAADGTGEAELLVGSEAEERLFDWSRDGRYLIYTKEPAGGGSDIWYLKQKDDGEGFDAVEFLATPFGEQSPNLSPDGSLLAYTSNRSGEAQVYIRSFPSGDGLLQVSTNGGAQPRWSGDGGELFYVEGNETLMAVKIRRSPTLRAGTPQRLFADPNLGTGPRSVNYDVADDGRFVLVSSVEKDEATEPAIHVVENWYEEFRGR